MPPSTRGHRPAVREVGLARAERQLVAGAERAAMPLVVAGRAIVGVQIGRERGVVRFDLTRPVVAAPRDLIVGEEEQPRRIALLEPEREPVEIGIAAGRRVQNRRLEGRVRHSRLNRRRPRTGLIDVVPLVLVAALAARVGRFEQEVAGEGVLDVHVPLEGVRRLVVRVDGERRRELRDLVQAREQVVDQQRRGATGVSEYWP